MASYKLQINNRSYEADVEADTPLLWVLRDHLGLVGTKYGCGVAQCGACTVHLNGTAVRSCSIPVSAIGQGKVTTIEGLSENGNHPVQLAWDEVDVPQCGYCQAGMIMAVASLLEKTPKPTDEQIEAAVSNLCRCGTYGRVKKAIHALAGTKA